MDSKMVVQFVNLSSGLEWLPTISVDWPGNIHFIRIQSTWLEQNLWERVLQDLDYDFLWYLSQGFYCIVYDCGSRSGRTPRAIWQGFPWIKWVLQRRWFDYCENPIFVKQVNVHDYFEKIYHGLERRSLVKIDYFKRLLNTDGISLHAYAKTSELDGQYDELQALCERAKSMWESMMFGCMERGVAVVESGGMRVGVLGAGHPDLGG